MDTAVDKRLPAPSNDQMNSHLHEHLVLQTPSLASSAPETPKILAPPKNNQNLVGRTDSYGRGHREVAKPFQCERPWTCLSFSTA
ncbi:hypothetical protein BDR05DRAFT_421017 [Suillus weaverae]|nr:hypothetical protein BDR05DRAFT_421017 [Suillus weaverae]